MTNKWFVYNPSIQDQKNSDMQMPCKLSKFTFVKWNIQTSQELYNVFVYILRSCIYYDWSCDDTFVFSVLEILLYVTRFKNTT
jgi:hypothetical protein